MAENRQYDNTNKGVAWLNKNKKSEKSPIYQGAGNYKGLHFVIAICERKTQSGEPLLSLSFSEPKPKDRDGIPF